MFPSAHSTIYRNEAGEVTGWDNPSYDDPYDDYDPYDYDDYEDDADYEWDLEEDEEDATA